MAAQKPTKAPKLDIAEDDGSRDGEDGGISDEQQQILERIVSIQSEIDLLNEQASEEILHVEQKYNKLRQPHFEKRSEMILSIPDFWPTTLFNNNQFSELLSEEDETVLQYLDDLTVEEYEDVKSGYKITFHFRPNPYFENDKLSKEVLLENSGETVVTGTTINWKPGKDLTERPVDPIAVKANRKRGLEDIPSFFCWFSDIEGSNEPAEIIKDDIWANPLQFYLSPDVALNTSYELEDEDEDDLDEEEEEDDPDEIVLSDAEEDEG